jgi:hypothetical protein
VPVSIRSPRSPRCCSTAGASRLAGDRRYSTRQTPGPKLIPGCAGGRIG